MFLRGEEDWDMAVEKPRAKKTRTSEQVRTQVSKSTRTIMHPAQLAERGPRPHGREAVMAAVLDAAMTLFAARGPASVSVRDIAAAAGVNHALVHRHFGSKQAVLRAVLERAAYELAAVAATITDSQGGIAQLFAASAERATYWRALARAILDGENPRALQRDFPTVHRMIELLQAEHRQPRKHVDSHSSPPPLDARLIVGTTSALTLGWLLFEPLLLAATGLDQCDREKVREQVIHMLQTMIARAQ
jgi:AcrR family transcriptional regulator